MTDIKTLPPETSSPEGPAVKGRSLLDTALLRLKRNRAAMVSLWAVSYTHLTLPTILLV